MSKLLKATIKPHRPHIAAKMTPENGYDETKHLHVKDLKKAKVITSAEAADLDDCLKDLAGSGSNAAGYLNAASAGMLDSKSLNDDAFIKALMATDSDEGDDTDSDDDSELGDDEPADLDDKVTA